MCFSFLLSQQEMLYFAFDNASFKIDTPDGKNHLHAAVIVAYQNKTNKKEESHLVIKRNSKSGSKRNQDPIYKVSYCQLPNRTIQGLKIVFHCVQLIKSNLILQMMQSGVY